METKPPREPQINGNYDSSLRKESYCNNCLATSFNQGKSQSRGKKRNIRACFPLKALQTSYWLYTSKITKKYCHTLLQTSDRQCK